MLQRLCTLTLLTACSALLLGCGPRGIQSIEIRPGAKEVFPMDRKGKTQKFTAAGMDKNGLFVQNADASWSTADPSVFTVDVAGQVTAVGSGEAELKASFQTFTATQILKVRIIDKVELSPGEDLTLKLSQEQQIKAVVKNDRGQPMADARLTWTMMGYAADVDQSGLVRGQAIGEAVLTARSGKAEARIKIVVQDR